MSELHISKAALHKRLSTKATPANIKLVLERLTAAPQRLRALSKGLSDAQLIIPLGEGERSFKRDLAHLLYCAERGTLPIYYALILDKPFMPRIRAERGWGKLLGYEQFDFIELLQVFKFHRQALMTVLWGLTANQWERAVKPEGKQRTESVYYSARGLCVHELGHLEDLTGKLGVL